MQPTLWFLLVIVPLAAFIAWLGNPYTRPLFLGRARRHGEREWWLSSMSLVGIPRAAIAVAAPEGFAFRLRPRSGSRVARLRWRPHARGDATAPEPAFADTVLVESDDPRVALALEHDGEWRDELRRVVYGEIPGMRGSSGVHARGGRLWISFSPSSDGRIEATAERVVQALAELAQRLEAVARGEPSDGRDRSARRAVWFRGFQIAMVTAAAGGAALHLVTFPSQLPRLLDPLDLLLPGIGAGLLLNFAAFLLAWRWFGGTSYAGLTALPHVVWGTIATPVVATLALRDANVLFDPHPATAHTFLEARLTEHTQRRLIGGWRRGHVIMWVIVPGPPAPGTAAMDALPISAAGALRLSKSPEPASAQPAGVLGHLLGAMAGALGPRPRPGTVGPIRVEIRPGLFGAPWVSDVIPLTGAEAATRSTGTR